MSSIIPNASINMSWLLKDIMYRSTYCIYECQPGFMENISAIALYNIFIFLALMFVWDAAEKTHKDIDVSIFNIKQKTEHEVACWLFDKLLYLGFLMNLIIAIMEIIISFS